MIDILDLRFAFLSRAAMAAGEVEEEDEDEEEQEEDEEEGGEGSEEGGSRLEKDPRVRAANEEAKKHRLRAKALAKQLRDAEKDRQEASEKDKPEIERLKGQITRLEKRLVDFDETKVRVQVLERAIEHGIDDVDFFEYKLRKTGHLVLDEDGDFPEELEEAVKKLASEMSGASKAPGGGRDAQQDEQEDERETRRLPKSPTLSGRKKTNHKDADLEALKRRYPALMQRG